MLSKAPAQGPAIVEAEIGYIRAIETHRNDLVTSTYTSAKTFLFQLETARQGLKTGIHDAEEAADFIYRATSFRILSIIQDYETMPINQAHLNVDFQLPIGHRTQALANAYATLKQERDLRFAIPTHLALDSFNQISRLALAFTNKSNKDPYATMIDYHGFTVALVHLAKHAAEGLRDDWEDLLQQSLQDYQQMQAPASGP